MREKVHVGEGGAGRRRVAEKEFQHGWGEGTLRWEEGERSQREKGREGQGDEVSGGRESELHG